MNRSHPAFHRPLHTFLLILLLLSAAAWILQAQPGRAASDQVVMQSWRLLQRVNSYQFATQIEQVTYPAPRLSNVGASSTRDSVYLSGQTNLAEETLLLSLGQNPANAASSTFLQNGVEIRVEKGKAWGRTGAQDWEPLENFSTDLFAPGSDAASFLTAARNVQYLESVTLQVGGADLSADRYRFDLDGRAYAGLIRDQMVKELQRAGKLPNGLSLDTADELARVNGSGEVWIGVDDLPLRVKMTLAFPQEKNGQRVEASLVTDFYGFDRKDIYAAQAWPVRTMALLGLPTRSDAWLTLAQQAAVILLTLLAVGWLVANTHRRAAYAAFAFLIILTMLASPLWEGSRAMAYYDEMERRQASSAASRPETTGDTLEDVWDPSVDPWQALAARPAEEGSLPASDQPLILQPAAANNAPLNQAAQGEEEVDSDGDGLTDAYETQFDITVLNPNAADTDGDGLMDNQELLLNLLPGKMDTDNDGILDLHEVQPFDVGGGNLYTNPLNPDTDRDGVIDGAECPERVAPNPMPAGWTPGNCRNTDAALEAEAGLPPTPDVFDVDDDQDGVPTIVDESPYMLAPDIFSKTSPLEISLSGMADNKVVIMDYQVRPTNPAHLTYSSNVLDWPSGDTDGQINRISDTTFADDMSATAQEADPRARYGDLRLLPMLEVELTGASLPLPMTTTMVISQTVSGFSGEFIFNGQGTSTAISMRSGTSGTHPTYLGQGVCEDFDEVSRIGDLSAGSGSGTVNVALNSLADGGYVIYVKDAADTTLRACLPIYPQANSTRTDAIVDDSMLSAYGISARNSSSGSILLYAPLNLVSDFDGTMPVAFAARIPFNSVSSGFEQSQQSVRIVWMLNMLTDICKPQPEDYDVDASGTWCDAEIPDRWDTDQAQVVHTYSEEFTLAGLSALEDRGVEMAVAFENPTKTSGVVPDALWGLMLGLERSFYAGRDINGDDQLDLTPDEIQHRFDPDFNSDIPDGDERLWGLPRDSFQVARYDYAFSDGVYKFMQEQVHELFAQYFPASLADRPDAATLLFARHTYLRSLSAGTSGVTCTSGSCSFDFNGQAVMTQAMLNWAPYQRSGEEWNTYAKEEYLDYLEAMLRARPENQPENDSLDWKYIIDGRMILARSQYAAYMGGIVSLVAFNGIPVIKFETQQLDKDLKNALEGSFFIIKEILESLSEVLVNKLTTNPNTAKTPAASNGANGVQQAVGQAAANPGSTQASTLTKILDSKLWDVLAFVGLAMNIATTLVDILGPDNNATKIAKRVLGTVTGVIETINALKDLTDAIQAYKLGQSLTKAAKVVAVVGLIIGIVLTWGMFIAVVAIGGIAAFSLAFNQMMAEAIAATVTLVILFVIGLIPVVGQIIVAVIALIDALIMAICYAAGAEDLNNEETGEEHWVNTWICGGITGAVSEVIAWVIYSQNYMIDLDNSERLNFLNFSQEMRDVSLGFSTGNDMSMDVQIENTITLSDIPNDWKAAAYWWQYSEGTARSATFAYKIQPSEVDIHEDLDRDDMSAQWVDVIDGKKWVGSFTASTDGTSIAMPAPGLNQDPTVYVSEGSAVPAQECWAVPVPIGVWWILVPVCYIRTERTTFQNPLGSSLTMDIFPATLDEFYTLTEVGNGGYSLAWGRDAALTFGAFQDADGDGLVSIAFGGNDPDDGYFDKDADGLSDYFEVAEGTNPTDFDTDGDGLHDADELRFASDPTRPDTDGDGLPDWEEYNGWLFTYGFMADGTPLETMVYSDVNLPDSDFDGISDKLEKVYGFNPVAPSKADILEYDLSLRELDSPLILLRLDEPGNTMLFSDSSNFAFDAYCQEPTCPVSGLDGRFAQAVRLDGDAYLNLPSTAQVLNLANGQAFTAGAWVRWTGGSGTILAKWNETTNGRQEMRLEVTSSGALRLVGSGGSATSTTLLPANSWVHAAAAYNGSQVTFYINGTAAGSAAWSSTTSGTVPAELTIGAYQGPLQMQGFFNGHIDEAIIYDRYLIAEEVNTRMVQAYYNLNDTFVRPGEYFNYQSIVENLLNSRFAYGLLTTLFSPLEAIVNWQQKLQPQTFVLKPDNPVVTGVNMITLSDTLQIEPTMNSTSLNIDQTAGGQIVDRRSESNLAELWLTFDTVTTVDTTQYFEDTSGWMPPRDAACTGSCSTSDQGILNNAVSFASGGNTPVSLPTLSRMNLINRSFTLAMWVQPGSGTGNLNLIDSTGDELSVFLRAESGSYVPEVYMNGSEITTGSILRTLLPGLWSHLVVRYDLSTQKLELYVNGARVASYSAISPLNTDATVTLGGTPQTAAYLVDDLRIFSRPLSSLDINYLAERTVLALNMDTAGYGDSSGYGQSVATVQNPMPAPGSVRGQALRSNTTLGQSGGMLKVTGNELLNMQDGAFTISVWIKPYDSGSSTVWEGVMGYNSTRSDAYPTIERQGARVRFGFGTGSAWWDYTSGDILNVGQWNHLSVTFRPSLPPATGYELVIYVNGAEKTSALATSAPTSSAGQVFFIGHSSHIYTSKAVGYQMDSYSDEWLSGPPDVYINRYDPNYTRIYGTNEEGEGYHSINVSKTYSNYETIWYEVWDGDAASADDFCGRGYHYWYSLPGNSSVTLSDGFNGRLDLNLTRASTLFHGEIDEVEIYRYGLDREQVYDQYNAIPITARLPLDDRPSSTSFDNRAFVGVQDNGTCDVPGCPAAGTVGLINQAVRFDGADDVIKAPVDTTSNYMVSLWFNTLCADCGLYSLWSQSTGGSVLNQLYLRSGNVCALAGTTEVCSSGTALNNGQWHFVTYTNQSGSTTLNLNGTVVNAAPSGNAISTAPDGEARLGYAPNASSPTLNGQLDDVRVFRYSQADEVVAQLRLRAPLALFHLDEGRDAESFHTATPDDWSLACSGSTCPTAESPGRLGFAAEFDGLDDELALSQTTFASTTQSFSVGLWVFPYQVRDQAQLLWSLNNASGSQRYALALDANSLKVCVRAGVGDTCDLTSQVELLKDNWNYLTLVVDRLASEERYRLYINGYIDSQGTQTSPTNGLKNLTAGTAFIGRMDELTVYQYSQSEIEVRNTFNYQVAQVEENTRLTLQIDADAPSVSLASFNPAFPYKDGRDQMLQVDAVDFSPAASLASGIGMVQMQVAHRNITQPAWKVVPVCMDSTGGTSFCGIFNPTAGDGAYTLSFMAVDRVGHPSQTEVYTLYVDDTAPTINANLADNSLQRASLHPSQPNTWILPLSGSIRDPELGDGSTPSRLNLNSVRITIYNKANEVVGAGTQLPTLNLVNGSYQWTLDYLFPEAEPTGKLRVVIEAADQVGNRQVREIPIRMDASPAISAVNTDGLPQPDNNNLDFTPGEENYILTNPPQGPTVITGTIRDIPEPDLPYMTTDGRDALSGVQKVEVAYSPVLDVSYLFNEPYPEGLLAWLPLDEAQLPVDDTGSPDPQALTRLFLDISPYQQSGVCRLPACPQTGFAGHREGSAYFTGGEQYINLGQAVSLSQRSFSASVWARREASGQSNAILWQGPAAIPAQRILLGLNARDQFVCGFGGTDLVTPLAYPDTDWHQWACTYDIQTGRRTIYRDGEAVASDTARPMPVTLENLYVGLSPLGGFGGFLDELMVFDRALDAETIKRQYQGVGQIYHLTVEDRFIQGGDTVLDSSGFYNRALLNTGTNDPFNKVVAGKAGPFALAFDGTDWLAVSESNQLELLSGTFSQAAWVYPTQAAAMDVISEMDENAEQRYPSISITADQRIRVGFGNRYTWWQVETTPVVTLNAWNFIAATFDGIKYTVYVNGLAVWSTNDLAGEVPYPARRFNIGQGFTGMLDDVRVYPRALSAYEIWTLFAISWQTAQMPDPIPPQTDQAFWSTNLLPGLEGPYRIDARGWDQWNHFDLDARVYNQWNGVMDTLAPRLVLDYTPIPGDDSLVTFHFYIEDLYLDEASVRINMCDGPVTLEKTFYNSAWYLSRGLPPNTSLFALEGSCEGDLESIYPLGVYACDAGGTCASADYPIPLLNALFLPVVTGASGTLLQQPPARLPSHAVSLAQSEMVRPDEAAPPELEVFTEAIHQRDVRSLMYFRLQGRAADPSGIESVQISIWQGGRLVFENEAARFGELWNALWVFHPGHPPEPGEYDLVVTATDRAGNQTRLEQILRVDYSK